MICLILGKKSKNVSKHNSNVDNSPTWRKNKEEIKSLSSERSSSWNDRRKHKTSKYHHRRKTLKRNRSSYHSSSSDDSDTNYPTYTRVSSSKLRKQSSKLKLRRVSPQNRGSRSSTPLSHSLSRRSDFELKSVKTNLDIIEAIFKKMIFGDIWSCRFFAKNLKKSKITLFST